jgi:hypothetical protein
MTDTLEPSRKITDLTRAELHSLVWQKAMIHVAADFGITGTGLAKICDRHKIPCPPRGHWAKLAVGRAMKPMPLPPAPKGASDRIAIQASEPRARYPKPEPVAEAVKAVATVPEVTDDPKELHPVIRSWIAEHRRLQRERTAENNRHRGRDQMFWQRPEIVDLTERDLYRFRVTSALFKGLEKAGAKIEEAPVTGRIKIRIGKQVLAFSVVEKLSRGIARKDTPPWTAFPEHHQSGLTSSGFLRISVTTHLDPKPPEWIETANSRMDSMLPEIVAALLSSGPVLDRMDQERLDRERRYAEEQARAREEARLREIDKRCFKALSDLSDSWREAQNLRRFIDELERRATEQGQAEIEGKSLEEWIGWARKKAEALDPFDYDLMAVFRTIAS